MITYGFYNSVNGDRLYDATQISALFDGIINDGVYMSVGKHFSITPATNNFGVILGSGRAWFNHTWTYNDSDLLVELDQAELTTSRIDAIVLKIDISVNVRENSIEVIKGTPAKSPVKPTITDDVETFYKVLAYVTIPPDAKSILTANIENRIGTDDAPFVTGIIDRVSTSELLTQWRAEFDVWSSEYQEDYETWTQEHKDSWEDWLNNKKAEINAWALSFEQASESDFNSWFANIRYVLDGDAAGHLQNEIDELQNDVAEKIEYVDETVEELKSEVRLTADGFNDATTVFNEDGSITVTYSNRIKNIIFSENTITETLTDPETEQVYSTKTTTFNADGSITETVV